jgi:NADPH-dependent 2,4-dienoyl-CoA reductase/sulfur reductase-like enzyme
MRATLAIVGNGGAAAEAVLALREQGHSGDIHLFADNHHPPYNPMLGTYLVSGEIPPDRAFPFGDDRAFYGANRITAHLGQAVTALDAAEQVIVTADGSSYQYDRCLVASGARPSVPPVPGLREALAALSRTGGEQDGPRDGPRDGRGDGWQAHRRPGRRVFTMRSLDDALGLKEAVDGLRSRPGPPARAAVIGASFVGVKIATVLHDLGMRVCLVESEPQILPTSAHPDCARVMEAHLLQEGYELRLGAALAGVETGSAGGTRHETVRLDFGAGPHDALPGAGGSDATLAGAPVPGGASGTACEGRAPQEDFDLVVVCTGTRSALGFIAAGQIDIGEGILVDERMRSSIPTLYAAGDVAQGRNLLSGRHEIIVLWSSARYQGRAAGRSLAGAPSGYAGSVPHNITHVGGMLFATVGCMKDYDRATVCREGDKLQVRVWQDGRLAGVNLLNRCCSAGAVKQALIRAATGVVTETEVTWTSFSG